MSNSYPKHCQNSNFSASVIIVIPYMPKVTSEKILPLEEHSDDDFNELFERTRWEKYCTEKNAVRTREDIEAIIINMHRAAGFEDDFLFVSGFQVGSATVVENNISEPII